MQLAVCSSRFKGRKSWGKGAREHKGPEETAEDCFSVAESRQISNRSSGFVHGVRTGDWGKRGGELSGDISKEKASS